MNLKLPKELRKEYIYVFSVQDKKIRIVNQKYQGKATAQKLFGTHSKLYFYEFPDLVTLNAFTIYDSVKNKKSLTDLVNSSREYCQDVPAWVLEYSAIWDLIKDDIAISFLPGARVNRASKATPEKLKKFLNIKVGSKKDILDGKVSTVFINLDTNVNKIVEKIKKGKFLDVRSAFVRYKEAGGTSSYIGTGFYGTETSNKNQYIILPEYKKIARPDPILKDLLSYFERSTGYPVSLNSNPDSISFENLKKLLSKYDNILSVSFGSKGENKIKFLKISNVITDYVNYGMNLIEKLINEYQNGYIIHYGDIFIFDKEEVEKSIDRLTDLFMSKDFKEFIENIKVGNDLKKKDDKIISSLKKDKEFLAELFPHQEISVSWITNLYRKKIPGALLADDMGLGKTLSTIGFLSTLPKGKDITIIATATLVGNWENEIEKFNPTLFKNHKIKILSYEKALREKIGKTDILILDEAQKIKNHKTEQFKNIASIKKEFTLILTGTPIENGIEDIINILTVIDPVFQKLKVLKKFQKRMDIFAIKIRSLIDPIYLQRKKSDIKNIDLESELRQIPEYIEATKEEIQLVKEIKAIYADKLIKENAKNNYEFYEPLQILTGLMRIRQAVSYPAALPQDLIDLLSPKMKVFVKSGILPSKYKKLESFLLKNKKNNERSVVFAQFTETIKFLKDELIKKGLKVITLTGSDSSTKRKMIVESFQQGLFDVIIISLKAGNAGITLTEANHVYIYDLWFNPQVLAQAIARVHRIGQNKDVNAHFLILKNTFDENIYDILYKKKDLINKFETGKLNSPDNMNENKIAIKLGEDFFLNKGRFKK